MDDRWIESFLVRMTQQVNMGNSMVGVCYRPHGQGEEFFSKVPKAIRIPFTQAGFF